MSEAQRSSLLIAPVRKNGVANGAFLSRSASSLVEVDEFCSPRFLSRNASTLIEVDEFCSSLGGERPIRSILIANNGMAAVKFIRSVRTWAYETFGTEKAILLVAMATPEDLRINAEHIRIADQFVEVPGGTNNNNYANVQLIAEMAEITRVDAVWPGWGHASENPDLPDALNARGIIFLGPPSSSMAALGDKIGSSLIAQAAEVPTLPWSGSHVKISAESCLISIPEEIYKEACVSTTEEAITSCQVIGYPAMIKASWGGGGKGIRKVHNDDEVKALFKQVQGEIPGSPIFIMKVASQSRHLEVQLLCDQHGNVAALHSRDCSVQRRHQKIIEEGPITVAPIEIVKKLEQSARRLAKSVNYIGAATVEYLYSMDTGEFFFLELNPRLQVEHPVTEWIADMNLPAAQIVIGMGIPLWQIPEIRRFYGMEHGGGYDAWRKTSVASTSFDFDTAESTKPKGHCVAVRVTSEDPDDGFKPTSGKVQELSFKSKPNVWAYFSVKSGGGIHEFSDSQFGHVFAFGESRALAIANMVLGLKEIQIRGEIRTNVDYTIDLLHVSDYRENKIHTGWLDSRIAMRVRAERLPWYLSVVGGALYIASSTSAAMVSEYIGYLQKGQIPPKRISLVHSEVSLNIDGNKYRIDMVRGGPGSYRLSMNGSEIEVEIHTLRDGGLLMQLDGTSHVIYAEEEAAGTRLLIDGRTCLLQNDHDPSNLMAETPCKLLRFLVSDGTHVDADKPYAEVEVMKMCMPLLSPASGVISFFMSEGQAMQAGELIAKLDLDDPSAVRKAEPFTERFPVLGLPTAISEKVHQRCAASLSAAQMILAGYDHNIDEVAQSLLNCLDDPQLPFLQWQECLSVIATRLPKDLKTELESKSMASGSEITEFPAKILRTIMESYVSSTSDKKKRSAHERLVEPLISVVKSYGRGREGHACRIVQSLFDEYLVVEELFSENLQADVIERLRLQHKKDLLKVVDVVLSHQGVRSKNKLILRLMEQLVYPNPAAYRDKLIRFSALGHIHYSELALKASQLLEQTKLSELRSSIARSLSELEMFTEEGESMDAGRRKSAIHERMESLITAPLAVEDALIGLFDHSDHTLQRRVVETYVRRLYQPYLVKGSVRMQWHRSGLICSWEFLKGEGNGKRCGIMVVIKSLPLVPVVLGAALKETTNLILPPGLSSCTDNMMHVVLVGISNQMSLLQDSGDEDQTQERIHKLAKILKDQELGSSLRTAGVGVISCIIQRDEGRTPMRHSFHWSADKLHYHEVPLLRHVEPPLSIYLELEKLNAYDQISYAPSRNRQWHLYTVLEKPSLIQRMFLRTLVRQSTGGNDGFTDAAAPPSCSSSIMSSLKAAMEELELNMHNKNAKADHAHMYLYVLREQRIDHVLNGRHSPGEEAAMFSEMMRGIHEVIGVRMHRLNVCEWEVRLCLGSSAGAWRIVVVNVTGHTCVVQVYREAEDKSRHAVVYHSVSSPQGPLHGVPLNVQYQPLSVVDRKRLLARRNSTTYCYDFPLAFEISLQRLWKKNSSSSSGRSESAVKVKELVFSDRNAAALAAVERLPGTNDVGMVAWLMEIATPEFENGRMIVVVSNDVTYRAGSFGPREDAFFHAVTDLACSRKLPLIYLAANSGARIGVAEEVKSCFRVCWSDESNPERGFQYLYLTPEDHASIASSVISHEITTAGGETRWVIDTIVGREDGLGVENLTGSGAIAGIYSRAYRETFTLTYVAGRTVGIGAYLARLGVRCIQRLDQPIILTGFSALNKLLGREVYSSHMQLGGPKIMATNGVVHLTVSDDLEGVSAILEWLSFVPAHAGGDLPVLPPVDPPDRPVEYFPENNACNPRAAISGLPGGPGGLFDRDSFIETLDGWARTVVTGRAKLGGIPVGVVAVETQTVMQVIPADPGQLDSHERVVPQAGQVWFPDSAAKTSQAISEFDREGLPLFILANWRGFSGGQRDLFEGILQAGSTIVENLRVYGHPVFVYIPVLGELRGGAWVVVDSRINPDRIEMYADRTARGNVLEPEGMIEIKFRARELVECMGRLDPSLRDLKLGIGGESAESLRKSREKQLLPVYTQVAARFAELHDTSLRMAAKGVIRAVVHWPSSRAFFYKRLRRRLAEDSVIRAVQDAAGGGFLRSSAVELLKDWFSRWDGRDNAWEDDEAFFLWSSDRANYHSGLQELQIRRILDQLSVVPDLTCQLPEALDRLLRTMQVADRVKLQDGVKKVLDRFSVCAEGGPPTNE